MSTRRTSPARRGAAEDLVGMVNASLDRSLTLEDFAALIGCSPRTVQRRLKHARTSFKALIDQARFDRALRRVVETDDSLTSIAMDLSYGNPSSFTRAFRRWTGMSPSDFRRLGRNRPVIRRELPVS